MPSVRRALADSARAAAAGTCLAFAFSAAASAQPLPAGGDGRYEPRRGQAGKDVIWIATPDAAVDRMLRMAGVRPGDRLVDLGAGDGKIAIAAARDHGAVATGLEFNPDLVELSRRRALQAGVAGRTEFRRADIFEADFADASVVAMYLLPELNLRLRPILFRMAPGTRVASHSFGMGDWAPDETAVVGTATLYLWRVPANASGTWEVDAPGQPEAPRRLRFSQRLQRVEGDASFGELRAGAIEPLLSGDALSFRVRDAAGAVLSVRARIDGDRMRGTLKREPGPGRPFEARRSGGAALIGGVDATPREIEEASRVLN